MSQSFKDTDGRTWSIVLTLGAVERLKHSELGLDLLRMDVPIAVAGKAEKLPPALLLEIDLPIVANVVWLLIEPEANRLGVSQQAFLESVDGDVFFAAKEALGRALTDFSQKLRRPEQVEMLSKSREAVDKMLAKAAKQTANLDIEMEVAKAMDKAMSSTSGNSSGSVRA